MQLSKTQVSALVAMGIPLWQQRGSTAVAVPQLAQSRGQALDLTDELCIMVAEAANTAEEQLLNAILFAMGIDAGQIRWLQPEQAEMLSQAADNQARVLLLAELPAVLKTAQPQDTNCVQLANGCRVFCGYELARLLAEPALKAALWQQYLRWSARQGD